MKPEHDQKLVDKYPKPLTEVKMAKRDLTKLRRPIVDNRQNKSS